MINKTDIPRPEYPRPQLVRKQWLNLNGYWDFEVDYGSSGKDRNWQNRDSLAQKILVPFCPESKLSGIGNIDFMKTVWYRREFTLPELWNTGKILLHFGAVDYEATVWINGTKAGTHKGGYTPFSFDITAFLKDGSNVISLCADDDCRAGKQPSGKQSRSYYSQGCDYTRTTGIWQTVWLEQVPEVYLGSYRLTPDCEHSCVHITYGIEGVFQNCLIEAEAFYNGESVGKATLNTSQSCPEHTLFLSQLHIWEPGNPALYDLSISVSANGTQTDYATGYFGLRNINWRNHSIQLNQKPIFQRLVLDQGFYPDGIYTALSDEDLKRDIERSMGLGFNGARLHEKIFEPRYLYWADRLGYLVWGEHGNWGIDISSPISLEHFLPEWLEALERDYNHPSIIGWCPFNETWDYDGRQQDNEVVRIVYLMTKSFDRTRPVIDTSGNYHVMTDIYDVHEYEQDSTLFAKYFEDTKVGVNVYDNHASRQKYAGQPYFISEYGGIKWDTENSNANSWGYGNTPESVEEFIKRYKELTLTLLDNPNICGFCYTQLYDVEQEVNGLYTYDRRPKFDTEVIRSINMTKAAIEIEALPEND